MFHARRVARKAAWAAAATCVLTTAVSCTAQGSRQESREPAYFQSLVSQTNGLYYHPFLREERGSTEAQSYALRILAETGAQPKVTVGATTAAALRSDALKTSALWGRYWLVPLRGAGVVAVLGRRDTQDVEKLRTVGGWYEDPALGEKSDQGRLGATWAALEVEAATGTLGKLPATDKAATADWLDRLADGRPKLDEAAVLARCLHLLGRSVLISLTSPAAPDTSRFTERPDEERADLLEDTYNYVLLQESAGRKPRVDRTTWRQVLSHDAGSLDYDQLYSLVHILRATGSSTGEFSSVTRRLEQERKPDGTVRDPSSYLGTPDASLFVQRLRSVGGWTVRDGHLLAAVEEQADSQDAPRDGTARLDLASLRHSAGGKSFSRQEAALCRDPATVPTTVTADNVVAWQRATWDCTESGVPTRVPSVPRWSVADLEGAQSAATLVVGLHQAGQDDRTPGWLTADVLRRWAADPGSRASVYDRALIVRAYLLLGGRADASLVRQLAGEFRAHRGCPGLPGLYRPDDEPGCDLKTTWAVWELDKALDRKLGTLPSQGP